MRRELRYYLAALGLLVLVFVSAFVHRAPFGKPPHWHTQVSSIVLFAVLIIVGVWGALILSRHFNPNGRS